MASPEETTEPPRGILNRTGTACHLNSALIILAHSLPPPISNDDSTTRCLLECLLALRRRDDSSPLDPTPWYDTSSIVSKQQSPNELGDAVEALRRLRHIQPAKEGSWQTILTNSTRRTKVLPRRPIPNPYPIPIKHAVSLVEALQASLCAVQTVENYQWEDACGGENSTTTTTRTRRVFALPSCWILHLQRFDRGALRVVGECHLRVELTFGTEELGLADLTVHHRYSLTGAILHIRSDEQDDDSQDDDEEGGHYVSLVVRGSGEWYAVDDEHTFSVQRSQVLRWIQGGGRWEGVDGDTHGVAMAVLLVFDASRDETEDLWRRAAAATMERGDPKCWVGRRISIRWKSGHYYAGRITAFHRETNKHTVLYNDGDIREYNLDTKTYSWV